MDSRIQDAVNDVLLKRDHDSVDDFEHLGHDGSPDDHSEQHQQQHQQQPLPRPIDAPRVDDLLHIGDSFQPLNSVLPSALLDAEAKPVPATPPPSADFDKCAAMAQSSDPFQQPLDPVDPKLASMAFVETERAYRHQFHDDDDDDDDDDNDNNVQEEIHLQPPLLPTSTIQDSDNDLLLASMKAIDSKVQPFEEREDTLFTDYGKQYERDVTPPDSANIDEDFMHNVRSSMLPAPEKSPLIDFLGDDRESSREDKIKNITDDDSWNMVERTDLKREQARVFEPPTKPLPPLPKEAQLLEKAHQDVYEISSDFLAAEITKPSPLLPQQTADSKHESIKRREISKPKEADHVSRPVGKNKQEIEIAPKEIFRDMGLGEYDRILFHFTLTINCLCKTEVIAGLRIILKYSHNHTCTLKCSKYKYYYV
ncbi:PREDICTED: uncharacterized protein LOC105456283 [Wasmannia auropunctata]|uniref:uncharacterized protein LOC105456283 n=1 Tax=Wasmannia auropunctata TaxID=64793 RepID=UPI0005ED7656|nr:PREDICTED: uncharacterized protein LOC105456283 [Wasmannia auropunctata]